MLLAYFDSSAFVKLLVEEPGSELAASIWDGCDAALSSRLAYPEVRAALAAAKRHSELDDHGLRSAERAWTAYWRAVRPIELTGMIEQRAGTLAGRYALRGADAVHLASALAVGDSNLVLAVWDKRLHAGAKRTNIRVAPANLDS